jgi:hypothetical protein
MKKVVRKRSVKSQKDSEVNSISGNRAFWAEVDKRSKQTGQSQSSVIVEACAALWKMPQIISKRVGRPKLVAKKVTR